MNEQDITKRIEEETKDLPIPDSISPSNMEKMLNEYIKSDNPGKNTNSQTNPDKYEAGMSDNNNARITSMRRKRIGIAVAACFGVIILGSGALGIIRHNMNNVKRYSADVAEETYDESPEHAEAVADEADEAPDEEISRVNETTSDNSISEEELEKQENEQLENSLVAEGVISTPSGYEDYYDTIYNAYQKEVAKYRSFDKGLGDEDIAVNEDITVNGASDEMEAAPEAATDTRDFSAAAKSSDETDIKGYSTTNTQEKNVDEGDIVKTDGEYIYSANPHGYYYNTYDTNACPSISITKATNGKLAKISTITLEIPKSQENADYRFEEFYVYNNYLIVLYEKNTEKNSGDYIRYVNQTCIEVYDITNRNNPKKVRTLYQSGNYTSSRISDGYLYTISNFIPDHLAFNNPQTNRTRYEDYIPSINDDLIDYKNIYYSPHMDSVETYVITAIDLNDPVGFTSSKAVSNKNSQVYVGEKSIYLYATIYDNIEKTEILRIGYSKGSLSIGNRAVIAGYLYDSFALSEYNRHLRIVSTIPANNFSWYDNRVWTDSAKTGFGYKVNEDINAVYVLDDNMRLKGKITGIAPGEQIYSARFFGDIGYFVTYRNTDPLFSVDFSDPKEPKILGQLKIPGFSNYLHFYGKDTLLGIGSEIDPYTQNFEGVKLSMFNIKDPTNVTESDKMILNNVYYTSAQYNHKAIMIDPEKNIFGFCYESENYNEYGDYSYDYYFSTYTYDTDKGFIETAKYKIAYDYMYDMDNIRGLYIDEYFYLVTPTEIESYRIGNDKMIDQLYLE